MSPAQAWLAFGALVLIIGVALGFNVVASIDGARHGLFAARAKVASLERSIARQKALLAARRVYTAAQGRMPEGDLEERRHVTAKMDELEARIPSLLGKDAQLRQEIDDLAREARRALVGTDLGDLAARTGQTLHHARVQAIEGEDIAITHDQGITKLRIAEAPARVRRLLLEDIPREPPIPAAIRDPSTIGAYSAAGEATAPAPAAAPDSPAMRAYRARLKQHQYYVLEAQLKVQAIYNQIAYLTAQHSQAQTDTSSAQSPSRRFYAQSRVSTYGAQITDAQRRAAEAARELSELQSNTPERPEETAADN